MQDKDSNRTIEELKQQKTNTAITGLRYSNRTIEELKFQNDYADNEKYRDSNRTIEELKLNARNALA